MAKLSNPKTRRALGTGLLLIAVATGVGAAWMGGYPYYTNLKTERVQKVLKVAFSQPETKTTYMKRQVKVGRPLTKIIIPKLKVSTMVVEGTSMKALAAGAGHYMDTPLPGEAGNVSIAGHRTMNGRPFENLDRLSPGDKVILETPLAKHTYVIVSDPWITALNDWSVVSPTPEPMLTLTTCHPKGTARERLVARAKLVGSRPLA